jgi:hypothetical protein
MPTKTFRGLMPDKSQTKISLSTRDGSTGYRIKKFQMVSNQPVNDDTEHIMMIWKLEQPTAAVAAGINAPDFSNQTLLGVGVYTNASSAHTVASFTGVVFDNEIFNQDIYITHSDEQAGIGCNYYLEIETMPLNLNENTVATLRDIRNSNSQ